MELFKLKIVTPKGIYYDGDVEILNVRTSNGQLGILANHLPLASVLEINEMNFVVDGKRKEYAISGGFIYVDKLETTIITNAIESKDEIDLDRALKAKQRAEERIKARKDDVDLVQAEVALKRSLARIHVKQDLD